MQNLFKRHFLTIGVSALLLTLYLTGLRQSFLNLDRFCDEAWNPAWIWSMQWGNAIRFALAQKSQAAIFGNREGIRELTTKDDINLQFVHNPMLENPHYKLALENIRGQLRQHGVSLLIVPVPTKMSLERASFPKILPYFDTFHWRPIRTFEQEDSKKAYQEIVQFFGDQTVDVYSAYEESLRKLPGGRLFFPRDNHWSSLGITVAAQATIERLRSFGWKTKKQNLVEAPMFDPAFGTSQLARFFKLPDAFENFVLTDDARQRFYSLEPRLDSPRSGRAIFLGTSYLNQKMVNYAEYSFPELVSQSINRHPHACGKASAGVWRTWAWLSRSNIKLQAGDLLIWEFPLHRFTNSPVPEDKIELQFAQTNTSDSLPFNLCPND